MEATFSPKRLPILDGVQYVISQKIDGFISTVARTGNFTGKTTVKIALLRVETTPRQSA
jgi:hypothetical protein